MADRQITPASLVFVWFIVASLAYSSAGSIQEYCTAKEAFRAQCEAHQVVVVEVAMYGRMRVGRCVKKDMGYLGCSVNVFSQIDGVCSGRRECEIGNVGVFLQNVAPCPEEISPYLEAAYDCIEVVSGQGKRCHIDGQTQAPAPPGYLASLVTEETGCGRKGHPWTIEVQPGQKVNLTIMDFTSGKNKASSIGGFNSNCVVYVGIKEVGQQLYTICGGQSRSRQTFLSQSQKVEVYLASPAETDGGYFMVHYEASGCPNPLYPDNMWFKRDSDHVTLGCYDSRSTWRLVCDGNEWKGDIGTCIQESAEEPKPRESISASSTMPLSTLSDGVIITIAVCAAVLLSVILLVIGMIFGRRNIEPPPFNIHGLPQDHPQYMTPDEALNYDRTLMTKKVPLLNGFDTYNPSSKHTGSPGDMVPQSSQTMGRYPNRSLPRPPDDANKKPSSEGIQSHNEDLHMLDI